MARALAKDRTRASVTGSRKEAADGKPRPRELEERDVRAFWESSPPAVFAACTADADALWIEEQLGAIGALSSTPLLQVVKIARASIDCAETLLINLPFLRGRELEHGRRWIEFDELLTPLAIRSVRRLDFLFCQLRAAWATIESDTTLRAKATLIERAEPPISIGTFRGNSLRAALHATTSLHWYLLDAMADIPEEITGPGEDHKNFRRSWRSTRVLRVRPITGDELRAWGWGLAIHPEPPPISGELLAGIHFRLERSIAGLRLEGEATGAESLEAELDDADLKSIEVLPIGVAKERLEKRPVDGFSQDVLEQDRHAAGVFEPRRPLSAFVLLALMTDSRVPLLHRKTYEHEFRNDVNAACAEARRAKSLRRKSDRSETNPIRTS